MSSPMMGLPRPPMFTAKLADFVATWKGWFSTAHNVLTAASTAGATAARPTTNQFAGMPYFDTTLGKPIWLKTPGAVPVWVDATGGAV